MKIFRYKATFPNKDIKRETYVTLFDNLEEETYIRIIKIELLGNTGTVPTDVELEHITNMLYAKALLRDELSKIRKEVQSSLNKMELWTEYLYQLSLIKELK